MIRLAVRRVRPSEEAGLRDWLTDLGGSRSEEALVTMADEGCAHETALLVQTSDGPLLVYAMEVEQRSKDAAMDSGHPIDAEHRRAMERALGDAPELDMVLDLRR